MAPIDYERFRGMPWSERLALFNAVSADERADLVRTHISRWLELHRHELSGEQIEVLEETIAFITSDLYVLPANENLRSQLLNIEKRAASLFSREQLLDALTMHWAPS